MKADGTKSGTLFLEVEFDEEGIWSDYDEKVGSTSSFITEWRS
jgi:hypothetical protein